MVVLTREFCWLSMYIVGAAGSAIATWRMSLTTPTISTVAAPNFSVLPTARSPPKYWLANA